jgi:tripartite-type tricarboxylate transporter receptor subunit TctC
VHIPYKGGAPLLNDLVGGQIPAGVDVLSEAIPQHRAGKVRILASSGAKRSAIAPEVPTFTELGYPQIQGDGWFAFHAPARTPQTTLDRLSSALGAAIRAADVTERLLKIGFEPVGSNAEELLRRMAEDRARWAPIVRASGFIVDQ